MLPKCSIKVRKGIIIVAGLAALLISPFLGVSNQWPLKELLFGSGIASEIFLRIRIPRVLLGLLTGAVLGGAGVVFQALFRNLLASPYTFGVASGASCGAAAVIILGWTGSLFGVYGVTGGGILGALLVTLLIYLLSTRGVSSTYMLLAGVAMSFFFSSLLLLMQYLSNFTESFQIVRWLMGGLETTDYQSVFCLLPIVVGGITYLLLHTAELDLILIGDELAYSRGVDVKRIRQKLFLVSSLMIGAVVSFTGPIGFVGIMIPHLCRLSLGVSHKVLLPYSVFAAGTFLVLCDSAARVIVAPADLPVGIITSLLGGPFFIWVLLRQRNKSLWL